MIVVSPWAGSSGPHSESADSDLNVAGPGLNAADLDLNAACSAAYDLIALPA